MPDTDADLRRTLRYLIARAFDGEPLEHGSLMAHLESLTPAQALWRSDPARHCIWEIVRHVQLWRLTVAKRVTIDPASPVPPEHWPALPDVKDDPAALAAAWRRELDGLRAGQARLLAGIDRLDLSMRNTHPPLAALPQWFAVLEVQVHDSYHVGQIAALRHEQGLPPVD